VSIGIYIYIHRYIYISIRTHTCINVSKDAAIDVICNTDFFFLDGYCSTVQGLLDWFEVDLGFAELSFIQIDLCVLCVFVLYSRGGYRRNL